jgi:hypothetical protein
MATSKEVKAYLISRKIVLLMREGYPKRQATAIAIRMYRDGELDINPRPQPNRTKDWRKTR